MACSTVLHVGFYAAQQESVAPNITVVHCAAHKGNLASKALTTVALFAELESLVNRTYTFITSSPKMVSGLGLPG